MLTGESIQQAFSLAYSLHPHREVAWEITREALKLNRVISNRQGTRPAADKPYKQKLHESNLLRVSTFMASEIWERDQESRAPKLTPRYVPNKEDLLYRYIKTLVWHSMDRPSVYAAVGIGGLLFTYRTSEIAAISVDFFDNINIRRFKGWLLNKVETRFRDVMFIPAGSGTKSSPPPSEYQFAFVNKSLATLAPLVADHPHACLNSGSLFDEYFCFDSVRTEAERVHVITNTECCGWARLVNEFNCASLDTRLEEPSGKLRLPLFDDGFNGPHSGPEGDMDQQSFEGRFDPEPLNTLEVKSMIQRFEDPLSAEHWLPQRIAA